MAKKEIITRWKSTAENDRASERIFNICNHGGVLSVDQSPFGRMDNGLVDFRGYRASGIMVKDVVAKDCDFSCADFSNCWLEANRFENCRFEHTDFTNSSDHGNTFEGCVFIGCKFKLASLGYKGSNFRNCHFEECGFQRANFVRVEFVGTDFVNCRLKGVDFFGSSFDNCKFEGVLEDVWFRGTFPSDMDIDDFGKPKTNKMFNVSFEDAELIDLTISDGCDLSTVKLKNSGRYVKFDHWLKRLQFLERNLSNWDNEQFKLEASRFVRVSMVHAQKQDWKIISLDDLEKHYGSGDIARKIIDVLSEVN